MVINPPKVKRLLLHLFLFCFVYTNAQELLPFVENFTKSNYNGDNQVWSVAQGNDNAIYFANNHFLLRYNGVHWEKYSLPNKTIIRSVFADEDKIYSGSYNEFGYWKRVNGQLQYNSLTKGKNFFIGESINEEIWKIFKHDNKIYFQSFNELYVFDGVKINKIRIPFQISYCFLVDNKIYAASVKDGVYLFEDAVFKKKESWQLVRNNIIHAIEKAKGKTFVFTQKNGVFVEENKKLDTIILKTLNGDYNSLRRLNHFQCGDGAGCYDKGYIITQVIYKLGEAKFIKMVEKLDEKELYGIENYIMVGLEYGDNDYDGEIDNKKIEIEFPRLLKVLKNK